MAQYRSKSRLSEKRKRSTKILQRRAAKSGRIRKSNFFEGLGTDSKTISFPKMILIAVYDRKQGPMTRPCGAESSCEKWHIVEVAQKICRREKGSVDRCGKQHGFSTEKRDKKCDKIGYTQSYPHYPQKNPHFQLIYIM